MVGGFSFRDDCGYLGVGRPGSIPFVSMRPGAYGRLLLMVYVRWKSGLLIHSDWLRPVTRGAWRGVQSGQTEEPDPTAGPGEGSSLAAWLYIGGHSTEEAVICLIILSNGDLQRDPGLPFVASWSARLAEEAMLSPPPLEPMSPIPTMDSQDSMLVQVSTPEVEAVTPVVLDQIRSVRRQRTRETSSPRTKSGSSASTAEFLFKDILCAEALIRQRVGSVKSTNRVPRWRLAREGPFPNERSQASLRVLGKGCLFRHTSYEWNDHAPPKGGLGVPLNHPRFLEWVGTPDTAWLLEMSPGHWCDTLSRDRALTAAMQLHKDACLMKSNLDVLDQYALALHGTASTILQRTIGGGSFPGAEVLTGAPGAHAGRISVQMEALGLWRPTMDPVRVMATRS